MSSGLSSKDLAGLYYGGVREAKEEQLLEPYRELTVSAQFVAEQTQRYLTQKLGRQGSKSGLAEDDLRRLIVQVEEETREELSDLERTKVVARLAAGFEDFDVLSALVENPQVNDIIVRAFNDISVQVGRLNYQTELSFADAESYRAFIENMLKRVGKACTTGTPVVDAAIGADIRACVTHESFSPPGSGPMLTLRISRQQQLSLESLAAKELAPLPLLRSLARLVAEGHHTLLIAGEVGTGKTTLLRALAGAIPAEEAILVIEDTHEIRLARRFVRTLLTREANTEGAGLITPAMAIRTGMRMAMNRLLLGEIRDAAAAEAFIDVCASGHAGMSTIHARSVRDALLRLELFLARAQGNVPTEVLRRQLTQAVKVLLHVGLDQEQGKRRILEAAQIVGCSDGAVQLAPLFTYIGKGAWRQGMTLSDERLTAGAVLRCEEVSY